jgi:hypothetical protein
MEDNIFDISFEHNGQQYTGWVNPSEKLSDGGKPVSFHVVLNDIFFGYLSYNNSKWNVNEQRPEELVCKTGGEIEKHYAVIPQPGQLGHEKENPGDGNIGKNNAGGYENLKAEQ